MRILVIGGTGQVGSHVVTDLQAMRHEAVPAARNPGPGGLAMDLRDAGRVEEAARGFDAAFLVTPLGPDEGEVGVAAVKALRGAGVSHIVYLAIHNLEAMGEIPHFAAKIPVKQAVLERAGDTVLQANFFIQNDRLAFPLLAEQGVYSLPVGSAGVWSIDVRDAARAAARVLAGEVSAGPVVPLCGPEKLTGPGMAQTWDRAMDRPVTYGGDDIAPFVARMRRMIPHLTDWLAHDMQVMMEVTQRHGCPATPEDMRQSEAAVGRPLRRHDQFVAQSLKEIEQ